MAGGGCGFWGAFLVFWFLGFVCGGRFWFFGGGDKYFGGYIVRADSISARFAVARSLRADMESAPTGRGKNLRPTANPTPPRTPCRGAHCAPEEPRGGTNTPGGINPAPTNKFCVSGQSGRAATTRATVGRDALIPPDPAAARTPASEINPAPTNKFCVSGQSGRAATTRATVGRDALIPPDPAAARTPAGGINPAPTNKFYVSGQTGTAQCLL